MSKKLKRKPRDVRDAFSLFYNGQGNFMTPYFVDSRIVGNLWVEISKGRGLSLDGPLTMREGNDTIYGVTVLERVNEDSFNECYSLSKGGFPSLEKAENYINSL